MFCSPRRLQELQTLTTSQICHQILDSLRWKRSLDGQVISIKILHDFHGFHGGFDGFRIGFSDRVFGSAFRIDIRSMAILLAFAAKEKVLEMLNCRVVGRTEENLRTSKACNFLDLRICRKMGMVSKPEKNSDYIIYNMYILIMIVVVIAIVIVIMMITIIMIYIYTDIIYI